VEILVESPVIILVPPGYPMALLKERNGPRELLISLNVISLNNLSIVVHKVETPRPIIHQVYVHSLQMLGADVQKVVIDDIVNGAFHSHVYLITQEGNAEAVDTHVTDALVVAVVRGCPIFVTEEVFKKNAEDIKSGRDSLSDAEAMRILEDIDETKLTKN